VTDDSPRFLIVRLGALGDVIHAIPAVAALRKRHPRARIDWMVDPRYTDLVRLVRGVDRTIPVDPRRGLTQLVSAFRAMWSAGYDAAIDLQGLLKSAVLARVAVPGRVIGFPSGQLREPLARVFYSPTSPSVLARHVIHKNLTLLQAVGVTDVDVAFPLTIPQTDAVDEIEARYGTGRYVLINPGAAWPNKRWPAARFGALAAAIRSRLGLPALVLWAPDEHALAADVVLASAGAAELCPRTAITDLFGVARSAALMVSGDTGPLHIATAVGTPVVALFDPHRNGPWSPFDAVVSRFEHCTCHYERRCRRAQECIGDIAVDEVLAAVEKRLGPHT